MIEILVQAVVLIWVPVIPLRLVLHGGTSLWRKLGDASYLIAFVYWLAIDILLIEFQPSWLNSHFTTFPGAEWLGWILLGTGLILGIWAASTLGLMVFLTRPQLSPKKSKAILIATGPYRWVRHPFYLSEWLFLLGIALLSQAWIVLFLAVLTILVDPLITRWEEKELVVRLGNDYADYQKRVPRLLPTFRMRLD